MTDISHQTQLAHDEAKLRVEAARRLIRHAEAGEFPACAAMRQIDILLYDALDYLRTR